MLKINDYAKMIHDNAVEKGWYESKQTPLSRHVLMISEIAEAVEEVRNHKESYYEIEGKPEGEATELADVLIRILDYLSYNQVNFIEFLNNQFFMRFDYLETFDDLVLAIKSKNNVKSLNELEQLEGPLDYHMSIAVSVGNASNSVLKSSNKEFFFLAEAFVKIMYYANLNNWNMEQILKTKHEYNVNRPYKHGGKKC